MSSNGSWRDVQRGRQWHRYTMDNSVLKLVGSSNQDDIKE